jgi:Spy/CpxP family protein refolding chaperone
MKTLKTHLMVGGALLLVAASGSPASAQQGRRAGPGGFGMFDRAGTFLLTQESVQSELKLSPDQVNEVTQLNEKRRESFRGMRDLSRDERRKKMEEMSHSDQAAIAKILNPEQLTRLKQISLQQRGGWALADPEVAATLALTDDQKERIRAIEIQAHDELRGAGRDGDRAAARQKFESVRSSINQQMEAVLTPQQQAKWKEMQGEPFKGELQRGEFRRRGNA